MPRLKHKLPSYCRHKASGQAVVTVDGRDVYLGPYASPESEKRYEQVIARLLASRQSSTLRACGETIPRDDLRIGELLVAYLEHADRYYRKNGRPTGEVPNIKDAVRQLADLYREDTVVDFGPTKLKTVRDAMVQSGLARKVVNARINRVRRVFKWGVENELVDPAVLQALQAVAPLKRGRNAVRETPEVKPVPEEHIEAVLATVTSQIHAMVETQMLTGMRPGELVIMRPCDIDRSGQTWVYRPESHKTEHHGIERQIFLGPRVQRILQPFLLRAASSYLFNPREAILERRREQRRRSNKPKVRANAKFNLRSLQRISERYTTKTYQQAVYKACKRACIPSWGPNRLRHNAATVLRKQFGIEVARVILGHTSSAMTEVYAEMDRAKAADIMWQVG